MNRFFFLIAALALSLSSIQAQAVDEFKWAPEIGMGLPQPIQVGVMAKCTGSEFFCREDLNYYFTTGIFKLGFGSGKVSVFVWSAELGTRYFPTKLPFFISAGFGFRHIGLTTNKLSQFKIEDEVVATSATIHLNTFYLTPGIGWNFTLSETLTLGIEAGIQYPIASWGDLYPENSANGENSDNSRTLSVNSGKAMGRIAGLMIPKITLVRLTWNFN